MDHLQKAQQGVQQPGLRKFSRFVADALARANMNSHQFSLKSRLSSATIYGIVNGYQEPKQATLDTLAEDLNAICGESVTSKYLVQLIAEDKQQIEPEYLIQLAERLISGIQTVESTLAELQRNGGVEALADLIKGSSGERIRVQTQNRTMTEQSSSDSPQSPSFIAAILLQLMEDTKLDRAGIADMLSVSLSRLNALIETRTPITDSEYAAITALINQNLNEGESVWTAESLKQSKEDWDRMIGRVNNNGISHE